MDAHGEMSDSIEHNLKHLPAGQDSLLHLEFFFYCDEKPFAEKIVAALVALHYQAETTNLSIGGKEQWLVSGRTLKMKMEVEILSQWVMQMQVTAKENHSRFEGWGILVE